MPHCWKSHITAQIIVFFATKQGLIFHAKFNDEKIVFDKFTNGVERETTGSSNDSLQLHLYVPFQNGNFSYMGG